MFSLGFHEVSAYFSLFQPGVQPRGCGTLEMTNTQSCKEMGRQATGTEAERHRKIDNIYKKYKRNYQNKFSGGNPNEWKKEHFEQFSVNFRDAISMRSSPNPLLRELSPLLSLLNGQMNQSAGVRHGGPAARLSGGCGGPLSGSSFSSSFHPFPGFPA